MGKLIVLKLDGDFNQGFRVTLEIGLEGDRPEVEIIGNLPPATYLIQEYGDSQSIYRSLGKRSRIIKVRETRSDVSLKKKIQECRTQAFKLRDRLNSWLKADSFVH